ncbi:hypothetical protein HED49_00475 [Ochrobactrum daejeonense]|nr:hypothetical protein [Brucella daejeonensis]
MGIDILPDVRQLAVLDGNGEDEMVLERPVRSLDLAPCETEDQDPISLRYVFAGLCVRFQRLGRR